MRIFAINPGSTSTKIALFDDDACVFSKNVSHDAEELATYQDVSDQLPYRKQTILDLLAEKGVDLEGVEAVVGRGGGLLPMEGGTYLVDDRLLEDARCGANGVSHPAQLGSQLAHEFARRYGACAFVVNPPDVDELQELARLTGIAGVYRTVHLHALNLKETAIRHAAVLGRSYDACNFVVCHIGGGVSVSAHRRGRMIDGFDIVGGEGPLAPTRCGSVALAGMVDWCEVHGLAAAKALCTKTGGFVDLTGTSDAIELTRRAEAGDKRAALVWNTMIYQIEKCIGSMAAVLAGEVDGILLGGGMVHSDDLVSQIVDACSWIAPVTAYPGEFEMEAMAAGAVRVMTGVEQAKRYTGQPAWTPPAWLCSQA
ncbi:butyrate kinase [Eggerthella sinensis]|uniref:butyrate kinase n=1 Tax=Eggerthella sinensis TaxID=242230 RepID=UPI0022E8EFCC|nr:butyrate kinase [Eggerthella sinensis]